MRDFVAPLYRQSAATRSVVTNAARQPISAVVHSLALAAGVAMVILTLAVGAGAHRAGRIPVEGLARNLVVVSDTAPSTSGVDVGLRSDSLTIDDVQALSTKSLVPDGGQVAPIAGLRTNLVSVARTWPTDVVGSTPAFASVRGYTVASGRFLSAADIQSAAPVMIVGQTLVDQLFAGHAPLGQQVSVNNRFFTVVGVFSRRGYSGTYNQDDLAVIPLTAAWADLFQNTSVIDQVVIEATSPARVQAVRAEATSALLQRHHFTNPAAADFEVHTLHDLISSEQQAASSTEHAFGLAALLLLLGACIHLSTLSEWLPGRWTPDIPIGQVAVEPAEVLADPVVRAALASLGGSVLAIVLAGVVRHMIGGIPALRVSPGAVVIGIVTGLLVGVAAWLPTFVRVKPQVPATAPAPSLPPC